MEVIEIVGFLAFLTNVAGNLMLAWQTIWGWVVRLVSISLWFVYAYSESSPSLIANAVTFFCINIFGLWKWKRAKKRCTVCGAPLLKGKDYCPAHDC